MVAVNSEEQKVSKFPLTTIEIKSIFEGRRTRTGELALTWVLIGRRWLQSADRRG